MTQTLARPNRYAATCVRCGGRIPAEQGLLARRDDGSWAADHPAECPPSTPVTPTLAVTEDGIYQSPDGTIYKVQIAKQGSGRLYAKRLTLSPCTDPDCGHPTIADQNGVHQHGHFNYAAGAIHTLTADMRLSEHDARTFGRLYGICCACGADLTDETSIANGIGPVCGKRFA